MQIAVLSDLHLGKRNALDRFARKHLHIEPRFLELLRHVERHVDRIVLLGDVFETLKGPHPGSAKSELRAVLESYPEIARRVTDDERYELVFGNHDLVAKSVLGASEYFELREGNTRHLFFHGHQLDPLARGRAWLSRAGIFASGWLERAGFETTPEDSAPQRDGPAWRSAPREFEQRAVALGKARGADVIVCGHTHRAVRAEVDGCLFLNSGTCVAGRRELLMIDTKAGSYEVVREPEVAEAAA